MASRDQQQREGQDRRRDGCKVAFVVACALVTATPGVAGLLAVPAGLDAGGAITGTLVTLIGLLLVLGASVGSRCVEWWVTAHRQEPAVAGPTCTVCDAALHPHERALECEACGAGYHPECLRQRGSRCRALGCEGASFRRREAAAGGKAPETRAAAVTVRPAAEGARTCAYCRDALAQGEATETCPGCGVVLHTDCWIEAGRCPSIACPTRRPDQRDRTR